MLFIDESHRVGRGKAERTKALYQIARHCDHVVDMTGTATGGKVIKLHSQYKMIDEGILGSDFSQFKRRIAVWGGYGGYKLIRYINLKWLKKQVAPYTFVAKKEECLDLPARTYELVPYTLGREARKVYDSMASESIAEFRGQELEAEIVLTRLLRLRQIASGHFRTEDGHETLDNRRSNQCLDILKNLMENERHKVVVACNEIPELRAAAAAAKEAGYQVLLFHGKTKESEREQRLADFDESDKTQAMIIQADTGSLGISLTAASEMIWYSVPQDLITWTQMNDRLHRIGQHSPVTYYVLAAKGTINYADYLSLKLKKRVEDLVLRYPELLMADDLDRFRIA
jgi:SNF2 family DNA or RNA helicase